jgi:hypothetical protein
MTPNDDFIGLLDGYLDEFEGTTPLPEHVRYAIHAQLPSTMQRAGRWPSPRFPVMNQATRLALASVAAVAVALLGFRLLVPGQGLGGPDVPSSVAPTPLVTPGELPASGALEEGAYFIDNPYTDGKPGRSCERGCSDYRRITFRLPAGWATSDGLVHKHLNEPDEAALSVWTVDRVYADPCHWQESELTPLDLENHSHLESGALLLPASYDGGLVNQLGRDASAPMEVTLGGQQALRIELSVPADLDITTCDRGELRSWSEWDVADGANSHHAGGQIDVVYLVDVDRRALVIDASHMAAISPEDLAELEGILASLHIDR